MGKKIRIDRILVNKSGAFDDLGFDTKFDFKSSTGAIVEIVAKKRMEGTVWCEAVNNQNKRIQSNVLEILDYRNQFRTEFPESGTSPPVDVHREHRFRLTTPYGWKFRFRDLCGVSYVWQFFKRSDYRTYGFKNRDWPVQVMRNGTMLWSFVPPDMKEEVKNVRHMYCTINGMLASQIYQFEFKPSQSSENVRRHLVMVEPEARTDEPLWDSKNAITTLPCVFSAGPGRFTVAWTHTAGTRVKTLRDDEFDSERRVSAKGNRLTFRGPFTKTTAGLYRCSVTWTPKGGGTKEMETVNGTYSVSPYGYPRVVNASGGSRLVDVLEGYDPAVTTEFFGFKDFDVTSFQINGRLFDTDVQSVSDSQYFRKSATAYLRRLEQDQSSHATFYYEVRYPSSNYAVRHYVIPRVIPGVTFDRDLSEYKCSAECPCLRESFKCEVRNKAKMKGLSWKTSWFSIDSEGTVKDLSETNAVLHLNASMKKHLQDSSIKCYVSFFNGTTLLLTKIMTAPIKVHICAPTKKLKQRRKKEPLEVSSNRPISTRWSDGKANSPLTTTPTRRPMEKATASVTTSSDVKTTIPIMKKEPLEVSSNRPISTRWSDGKANSPLTTTPTRRPMEKATASVATSSDVKTIFLIITSVVFQLCALLQRHVL